MTDHEAAVASGFAFVGKHRLYQGSEAELAAFAQRIREDEREAVLKQFADTADHMEQNAEAVGKYGLEVEARARLLSALNVREVVAAIRSSPKEAEPRGVM